MNSTPSTTPPLDAPAAVRPRPGGFELLRALAKGGCGEVHLGRHQILGHLRAVKVLLADAAAVEEEAIRLYKQSIRIEDYRLLVPVEDYDRLPDGRPYYVMPLADHAGPQSMWLPEQYVPLTLDERLQDFGPLPVEEVLDVADRLLLALSRLHGYGLLHLDIKPANVVRIEGAWRLGDFGLMIRRGRSRAVGRRGTPGFVAPETPLDFSSDVYSLAITLRVLLAEPEHLAGDAADSLAVKLRELIARACEADPRLRPNLPQMHAEVSRLIPRKVWLEIRLPEDFDAWTPQKQAGWKERIEALGVIVQGEAVARGSVRYCVQVTPAQAEYLHAAVDCKALAQFGVSGATVIPTATVIPAAGRREPPSPRFWIFSLGPLIGMALTALVVYLMSPIDRGDKVDRPRIEYQTEVPDALLHDLPAVTLRSGGELNVDVHADRREAVGDLSIRLEGLPPGVQCSVTAVPPGEGPLARLRFSAAADVAAGRHVIRVHLLEGGKAVDERPLFLRTKPFIRPDLGDVSNIDLIRGEKTDVVVAVERNGNADVLSLTLGEMPTGVRAEPLDALGPDHVGMRLTVAADAPLLSPGIVRLVLLADGVPAREKNVSLSLRSSTSPAPKAEPQVLLKLEETLTLESGRMVKLLVRLERRNYKGPVVLAAEKLPVGVRVAEVTVPADRDFAEMLIEAPANELAKLDGERIEIVARAGQQRAGGERVTLRLLPTREKKDK